MCPVLGHHSRKIHITMEALMVAIRAVNAGEPALSALERKLQYAKAAGKFDGSVESALKVIGNQEGK